MKIEEIENIADSLETYGAEGIYLTPPMTGSGEDVIAFAKAVKKLLAVAKAATEMQAHTHWGMAESEYEASDKLSQTLADLERE